MADALVFVLVEPLASLLLEPLQEEVGLVVGAREEVKKLSSTFKKIRAVLNDAENQQLKDKSIKVWLQELKDVAYEIEDVLDDWHTRILKSQMDGVYDNAGPSSRKRKVSSYFLSPCSCFNKLSLPHKREMKDWQDVLASDLWELPKVSKGVLPPLLLSYSALPSHLKRCFTYCVVYIKDYRLRKDVLVKQWMSQGFILSSPTRDMEIIGGEYFDDLASHSFFQDLEINVIFGGVSCKMHDLMHDFAKFVANNEYSIVESSNTEFDYAKTRHLTLEIRESNASFIPPPILNAKNLQTFFGYVYSNPRANLDIKLLHHLKCLRTLDLSRIAIETLPNELGSLIHLRYLDLSYTNLVELPETVCNLRNLQTLRLNRCEKLHRLPEGLKKLVNLRHLELDCTWALECLPNGLQGLRDLQTLSKFVMSEEGCQLRELSNLNNLRGTLVIANIRGGGSKEALSHANLKSKEHLRTLGLQFVEDAYEEKRDDDASAMELLEPHPNLEKLGIRNYGGSKFPNWMEFQSSSIRLCRLIILNCRNLEVLPHLSMLESLQFLFLI